MARAMMEQMCQLMQKFKGLVTELEHRSGRGRLPAELRRKAERLKQDMDRLWPTYKREALKRGVDGEIIGQAEAEIKSLGLILALEPPSLS